MDLNIFIAILGGLINLILSLIIPVLLKDVTQPFLNEVNTIYKTYRQLIITSSLIVTLTIYISLSIGPNVEDMLSSLVPSVNNQNSQLKFNNLSNLSNLSCKSNYYNDNDNNNIRLIISELSED